VQDQNALGAIDPDQEPYRSELRQSDVTVINLTGLNSGDSLNHSKFAESPEVVQIIGRQIAGGQILTDSRVGIGDVIIEATTGVASSVGKAAGVVVSAPIAIVDPRTRETFGDQVQDLGRSLTGRGMP
jgi:esterase/lipase superfamily enzyme